MELPEDTMTRFDPSLNFFRRLTSDLSGTGISFQLHALIFWLTIAAIFMLACLYMKFNKRNKFHRAEFVRSTSLTVNNRRSVNEFFGGGSNEDIVAMDGRYAEQLQLREVLLASIAATSVNNADSSDSDSESESGAVIDSSDSESESGADIDSSDSESESGAVIDHQSYCEICFENRETWQMYRNKDCSRTFCHDCTGKHIVVKIEQHVKRVTCPGLHCDATLDFDSCRSLIPPDAVARWDEILCESLIPDSQKLYCPFRDCSTLLVDDSGLVRRKERCPLCKRSFCAQCHVPWHSEFSCKEFQVLNKQKGEGEGEVMMRALAEKKNWRKCSNCKTYVEKTQGCVHMSCRCEHEFCYRCGAEWSLCRGRCS